MNPGLYVPTTDSVDLDHKGILGFGTWLSDGCGHADLQYSTHIDTVSFGGLTIDNQAFASLVENPPKKKIFRKKFPHDGIAGMTGRSGLLGHHGWVKNLCTQRKLEECRFGLALGTAGTGKQVFGGVDHSLFDGELTTPRYRGWEGGWHANVVLDGKTTVIAKRSMGLFDSGTANVSH